ncbi:hypothetical protein NLU13_0804 [Sarocladium strictum]|uniref:Uncharacterized protein n=1 Tax=Sarocladium strictum TaxID=5046 RepID=A0AA39GR75_SARSR|nr:hypothetical protein NLU13_0804 [Sarocladium strictum]
MGFFAHAILNRLKMAATSPVEDPQVLIAIQLNTLHLNTQFSGGGEPQQASVGTEEYVSQDLPDLHNRIKAEAEAEIKQEDLSEEETSKRSRTSTPRSSVEDEDMMMNPKMLERQARFRAQLEEDDLIVIDETNLEEARAQLKRQMEAERQRFSGASHWAPAEERLFELLFMREHLALMPRHWGYDFQGVPFQDHVFSTSPQNPPIIYAHSRKTEFLATKGMMNLIDLSSKVRTLLQSGLTHKAPGTIEKTLNAFLAWAAADGGYHKLEIIPNLIAEVVEADADHVAVIKSRMDALAQLHRDFLRADRNNHSWQSVKTEVHDQGFLMAGSPSSSARLKTKSRMSLGQASPQQRAALAAGVSPSSAPSKAPGQKRKRSQDDDTATPERPKKMRNTPDKTLHRSRRLSPRTPFRSKQQNGFTRQPPVVWGLFIINTSVFLCSLDAAKAEHDAYVSWHAEIAFTQTRQCVWHALTIALVVCLARDEMMTRLEDFEHLPEEVEEDPDL